MTKFFTGIGAVVAALFVALFAQTAAADTLAVGTGANNSNQGIMFDVTATNTVTLTGLTFETISDAGTFHVYGRPSTFVGNASSSTGWTLLASGSMSAGSNQVFPTAFTFVIPAGSTYALYVVRNDNMTMGYKNSLQTIGAVEASDANIQIKAGGGLNAPPLFNGICCQPRVFSGAIAYSVGEPAAVPTMSEWAMILFGIMLAGGAALYIQRRRQFV